MGYKKMDASLTFADLALESSLKHNRSLKFMQKLDSTINWSRVELILLSHYTVGTSGEGADAYPPLLLFKCLLLQKWFLINSDPELENQINDRLSFKRFLGLSFDRPSPDHSTFSRFRSRLSNNAMDEINFLPYCTVYSRHTKQPIEKVFADKGYAALPNRQFLAENTIADGIMRKDSTTAKLTEQEIERNKKSPRSDTLWNNTLASAI